ncbi:MAG: hypothetical protein NG784_07085 [Candidatus Jettenia sp.]|nr:hypothetical protein [Candidatus Jettenia sp.]
MDRKQIEKIPEIVTIEFSERTVRQCRHYNRSEVCDDINPPLNPLPGGDFFIPLLGGVRGICIKLKCGNGGE